MSDESNVSRRRFLGVAGGAGAFALAALAGCTTGATASPSPASGVFPGGASGVFPGGAGKKYYFVSGNINDPYYNDVTAALKLASDWYGFQTQLTGAPDVNIQNIVTTMETLIAKPDTSGLIVPTLDAKAYIPVFNDAATAKIPVVTYNVDTTAPRIAFLGPSDVDLMQRATDVLAKQINAKGKVAFVAQIQAQQDLRARGDMLKANLAKSYPNVEFVGSYNYNGKPDDAVATFEAIHGKYPDLAGLFWGDGSGGPAAAAIHSAAPNVALLLDDTVTASTKAVKDGNAFACIGQSTFDTTFYCVVSLHMWQLGLRVPGIQYIAQAVITKDNVDAFIASPYRHKPGAVTP